MHYSLFSSAAHQGSQVSLVGTCGRDFLRRKFGEEIEKVEMPWQWQAAVHKMNGEGVSVKHGDNGGPSEYGTS